MESLNAEFALYGGKNVCTRSDTVFFPLSEVSNGVVSASVPKLPKKIKGGSPR